MKTKVIRYIGGGFASLFLVFALSAAQASPVCALMGDCSSSNTVLKCDGDRCCTVTKDDSEICDCGPDE
jgi:hypothetical protein